MRERRKIYICKEHIDLNQRAVRVRRSKTKGSTFRTNTDRDERVGDSSLRRNWAIPSQMGMSHHSWIWEWTSSNGNWAKVKTWKWIQWSLRKTLKWSLDEVSYES